MRHRMQNACKDKKFDCLFNFYGLITRANF